VKLLEIDNTVRAAACSMPFRRSIMNKVGCSSAGVEILLWRAGVKPSSDAMRIMISAWRLAMKT
jgi:hypothetical protein